MSAPGWYPNPDSTGAGERYFDGETWTEEYRARPGDENEAVGSAAVENEAVGNGNESAARPAAPAPVRQARVPYKNPAIAREVQWGDTGSLKDNPETKQQRSSKVGLYALIGFVLLALLGIGAYVLSFAS